MGVCNRIRFYKLICGVSKKVCYFFLFSEISDFNYKLFKGIIIYFFC